MSAPDAFLDTKVIVYLLSADARKADIAEALVAAGGIVSVQVLNEAVAVARRKLALPWAEIQAWLAAVRACCRVAPLTEADHDLALDLALDLAACHGPWYDALIVASALHGGASILLTEDLQHGQRFGGRLRVVDPFRG
ncbi:tRNA(fMet)-specific endonuclease VapC [Tepidimonas alkaliphilus]|uniref:Ribonuclease VapC n=1 Tax=Tepidimonas alkaliphilus TaxID=2588942 RepID=A0A554W7D2_9BURK|nr:PIN domain-containing protein [Tepidimonas alkaliphilus]TSE19493.1 tRNA(fMet)-specific endonuclease VapC [Tepidimonas alkaliphilus]